MEPEGPLQGSNVLLAYCAFFIVVAIGYYLIIAGNKPSESQQSTQGNFNLCLITDL